MPIPGPRTQSGPLPGYRNPDREAPTRFNHWKTPGPVMWPGRTPGTMVVSLRGNILGFGQIRRMWRQAVNLIPAQAPYSWTSNSNLSRGQRPVGVTRALRYMTRSTYERGGNDNSRFLGLHTVITKHNRGLPATKTAGNVRNRPTIRNRMVSFGSRVPTLNQRVAAAQDQSVGRNKQA